MLLAQRASIAASTVYADCCATVTDAPLKARLIANSTQADVQAAKYAAKGSVGALHSIAACPLAGGATTADFTWLYEQRLVSSKAGRIHYEAIRDGNRDSRCALCNVRQASTLDHHLPKSTHPIFAIAPDNLLPACKDCNVTKLANLTPTLNPYFDDLGSGPWLTVLVLPGTPFVPDFGLAVQPSWPSDLATRAQAHFELFDLRGLYAYSANRQISGIRHRLEGIHSLQGLVGVRIHLQGEADSWTIREPNSWESALYSALAASDWFCDGGFRH